MPVLTCSINQPGPVEIWGPYWHIQHNQIIILQCKRRAN